MPQAGKRTLAIALVSIFSVATAIVAARAQTPAAATQSSAPGSTNLAGGAVQKYQGAEGHSGGPGDPRDGVYYGIARESSASSGHVRKERGMAFEKDDKQPKEVARKMIEMMTAINKENFEGKREVTCNTCHHGAAHPVGTPLVAVEGEKPASMIGLPRQKTGCFAAFGGRCVCEISERFGRSGGDPENLRVAWEKGIDQRVLAINTLESKSSQRLPTSGLRR